MTQPQPDFTKLQATVNSMKHNFKIGAKNPSHNKISQQV